MKPIRVLFPFVGDTVGGSHVSTLELVHGLHTTRYEPVIVLHGGGLLQDHLKGQSIPHIGAPQVPIAAATGSLAREIRAVLMAAPSLARFLMRQRIGIVHTNDLRMHVTWSVAAKLARAKFVWHQRSAVRSRRFVAYSRLADALLTISEHCRSVFLPGMAGRAQVIANPVSSRFGGLDRVRQRALLLDEMEVPRADGAALVGIVANLTDQKRPLIFVEAAARLRKTLGDGARFVMIGETRGELGRQAEARIAELGLAGRCILLGPKFPVDPWMAGLDVLLAPAVNEGFGRTLVEAMLCGTPVVAADSGGHREILTNGVTGLLVPADEAAAFAGAVRKLLDDPQAARRLAERARSEAMKRYSVAVHVEKVETIYDSLVCRS